MPSARRCVPGVEKVTSSSPHDLSSSNKLQSRRIELSPGQNNSSSGQSAQGVLPLCFFLMRYRLRPHFPFFPSVCRTRTQLDRDPGSRTRKQPKNVWTTFSIPPPPRRLFSGKTRSRSSRGAPGYSLRDPRGLSMVIVSQMAE